MDDDLGNVSYETFWGHFDELRKALVRMMAVIALSAFLSFFFYSAIIQFLSGPYISSLPSDLKQERIEHFLITNDTRDIKEFVPPEGANFDRALDNQGKFILQPGESLTYFIKSNLKHSLVLLSPLEGMLTALKLCLFIGAFISSPIWLLILMQFLAPALKTEEKRLIIPFLLISLIFISLGASFAYLVTIPIANTYLSSFNDVIGTNMWSLGAYLDYTLFLLLANGIAFEFFAVGLFLVHLRIIDTSQMVAKRRFAILGAFILGALLTPPDVMTQLMLAIPLIILYECLIFYSRLTRRSAHELQS